MRELNIVFYYLLIAVACFFMMLLANIINLSVLNFISVYLLLLMGFWYSLFSFRHPEFTQKAIKEAKVLRYQNSINTGIDTEVVLARLDELMDEEKIFTDDELTLPKLSAKLMITPHQLSMILNSKRRMNFRSLVNSYRIRESMKQMAEFPDKTVLDITLDCGFNSKSSFNAVFIKMTGTTPTNYRRSLNH
jgi:AraC-like DNA-binding protein